MKYILSVFILFLFSCKKGEQRCDCILPYQIYYLKAEVIQTKNIDCGKPVLYFIEDSVRIRNITSQQELTFIGEGLPVSMNQLAKKLYVDVRLLKPEESFPCTAYGINYPQIKILDAKER